MKLIDKVAIVLAILAIISAGSITLNTVNYVRWTRALRSVQLKLSSLELKEEGSPEVLVTFQLKNGYDGNMRLEHFRLALYLNENFMGSNYEPFVKRNLTAFEETTLGFVVPIRPFYLQHIRKARENEDFLWSVHSRAKVVFPFNEKGIMLDIGEDWSGY